MAGVSLENSRSKISTANIGLSDNDEHNDQNKLSACLDAMDISLQSLHPSMSLKTNPVLRKVAESSNKQIEKVLVQYCFLPAEIVNLLSMARQRLLFWADIEFELTRNINEELGSRTNGISHYEILQRVLHKELGLDILNAKETPCTSRFLNAIKKLLACSVNSCVAGAVYGLESAAVPELIIVAELINHYALVVGHLKPLIRLPAERLYIKSEAGYTLNTFFSMHLLDFEVGHKNGLAMAIRKQYAKAELDLYQFKSGFEFVLNQMDQWWEELACL
jgi:hypothetical protein